jgi:hypothetical protein
MKKTFSTALIAGALTFAISSAFAQVGLEKPDELNKEQMAQAKTHATAALESAKGGQAAGVVEHAKESWKMAKEITGDDVLPYYERAMEKLGTAITAGEKGDAAAAVAPLEGAIADMNAGEAID